MLYVYSCLMSLRHALMALLAATPMTGYTLAKQFDQSAAFVWHAPHSQIYPELRHLEEAGLIAGHEESRGVRGTKRKMRTSCCRRSSPPRSIRAG